MYECSNRGVPASICCNWCRPSIEAQRQLPCHWLLTIQLPCHWLLTKHRLQLSTELICSSQPVSFSVHLCSLIIYQRLLLLLLLLFLLLLLLLLLLQLSMDPGLKGCQYLLGTLPSWINYTEREKMEVRHVSCIRILSHTLMQTLTRVTSFNSTC
jgi:hypothetical protein